MKKRLSAAYERKLHNPKMKLCTFLLPVEMAKRLKERATENDRNMAQEMRRILRKEFSLK